MSEAQTSSSLSPETIQSYSLLRESCGILPVSRLSLVEMRGDDRKAWLQGQCTNDLRKFDSGASITFCVCAPTGQLLAPCTAWALPDRFLIALPRPCLPAFLERAEAMIIMEDVQVRDVSDDYNWASIQGPAASSELGQLFDLPALDAGENDDVLLLRANRTGLGGWDVLSNSKSSEFAKHFERVNEEALYIARLEAGIPWFGIDMNEKTLPPEMGPEFELKNISYSKGCYTGQEVLMRIHSRGHTNRTWVGLSLDAPAKPGDTISHVSRPDAGIITSAAESPRFGFIAGAMVRNEVASEGEVVSVKSSAGDIEGDVARMPLLRIG